MISKLLMLTIVYTNLFYFLFIHVDGTDYWIGGLDANKNKELNWMTGKNKKKKY